MPNEVTDLEQKRPFFLALIDQDDLPQLKDALSFADGDITVVHSTTHMLHELNKRAADLVIYDLGSVAAQHDVGWKMCIAILTAKDDTLKVLVACHHPDESFWDEVLNLGAFNLVHTPFVGKEMEEVIAPVLRKK